MTRTSGHTKEESFNFRVPAELKANFQKAAEMSDRPAAQIIRDFMRAYVNEYQKAEVGYDAWFRKQVQIALDNPHPGKSHRDIMEQIRLLIDEAVKKEHEN